MNKFNIKKIFFIIVGIFLVAQISGEGIYAANPDTAMTIDQSGTEMSLWQMIIAGGSVMIVIGLLSLAAVAMIIYDFVTIKVNKLAPIKFSEEIIEKLENKKLKEVRDLCVKENSNIIARIVLSGLDKSKRGHADTLVKEAMENRARMEIGNLWQNLNYLSDIAAIAPLLGLLGTVLGMIQAFNAIVVQSSGLKPILLAGGIAKAMITTASGLIVAIPVLLFYSYFRGKVVEVTNVVETYSTDIIKIMEKI